ncbi:MAG: MarR family transcriptional regulator [Alkaliphilus sp.]|nr:MarR family transcriptional regulator [bacterium AH-315-L21]MBN4067574.1 MarR family transcriptional regulator [Alkaliphilus transvaalensis]PHS33869.1 MAG: MarR family transcriptional regulator [Alkaliphilus sp.]
MRNYYVKIYEYIEKLVRDTICFERKGIKCNGDTLSLTEIFILKTINSSKNKKIIEIMRHSEVDKNTFSFIVKKLVSIDFICKEKSKDDGRIQLLKLTDKGKIFLGSAKTKEKEMLFALLRDFTFNEEKIILKFLVKLDMLKNER